ncbi:MAG TPA: cob(I)yrinic acid a,c-diamide adenosyltransferase [Candidatus Pacearchaeota archaeon]|nr:cob(I)yrinic acid a,c-diamide adenosyltransferase [Candidatus Pacearchaeota archaeon]
MKQDLGLVHVYVGDGKGKTSMAMGLLIRSLGRGLSVKVIQLFKRDTGEQFFLEKSKIDYLQFKPAHPFFKEYTPEEVEGLKNELKIFLDSALHDIEKYDVVLIDEIGPGIKQGLINEEFAVEIVKNKPKNTELVLTGRDIPNSILALADYVSEVKKIKHPFDEGIDAREGIEF